MSRRQRVHEVFLSHAQADAEVASVVAEAFEKNGLSVFSPEQVPHGETISKAIRNALAECRAVVVLATPLFLRSPNLAFEIGAGMAWQKAIYILRYGVHQEKLPAFLQEFRNYPADKIETVVRAVARQSTALMGDEHRLLSQLYLKYAIPTDQLLRNPSALQELTDAFNKLSERERSPEQLLQAMIRQRKQGKWPPLKSKTKRG